MPVYEVMRKVDAWVREVTTVEARTEEEALEIAYADERNLQWEDAGTQRFDDRKFVIRNPNTLDV